MTRRQWRGVGLATARLGLALGIASTVVPLSACSGPASCRGLAYDIAVGAKGAASQKAALDAFLASGDSRDFPTGNWTGPSAAGVFTSGAASVTVSQTNGSKDWFVTEAKSC
jgi:hypothetical protein